MEPPLNVSAFLDELTELIRKYGIAVSGSDWGAVLSRIERDPGWSPLQARPTSDRIAHRLRACRRAGLLVAGFRVRMVARVAILVEHLTESGGLVPEHLERSGADQAFAWIKVRYPHLELRRFGLERADLLARMIEFRSKIDLNAIRVIAPQPDPTCFTSDPVVWGIEFEDNQQATDFKLRWV